MEKMGKKIVQNIVKMKLQWKREAALFSLVGSWTFSNRTKSKMANKEKSTLPWITFNSKGHNNH